MVGDTNMRNFFLLSCIISLSCCPALSSQQYIQQLHEQQYQKQQKVNSTVQQISSVNQKTVSGDYNKYYQEALKQIEQNNMYGAQTSLCKALEIKHDFFNAIKTRGAVRNRLGNYNGAIQDFNNAISLKSNDGDLYYGRGFAKLALQNYSEAVQDFNKAIELNPSDYEAYHQRGYSYCLWGKSTNTPEYFKKAIADFNKTLSLHAKNTEAHLYRGMAYAELWGAAKGKAEIEYAMQQYKQDGDEAGYQRSKEIYNWIMNDY